MSSTQLDLLVILVLFCLIYLPMMVLLAIAVIRGKDYDATRSTSGIPHEDIATSKEYWRRQNFEVDRNRWEKGL